MATSNPGFMQRLEMYRPSKAALAWCCVLSVIATMSVGFIWGGWVTGGTAAGMAEKAADSASAKLAATICAAQFNKGPDAALQLAALNKLDSWQRSDFIAKGGWSTLPGMKDAVSGASELCARELTGSKL